jgi:hypothetical protein
MSGLKCFFITIYQEMTELRNRIGVGGRGVPYKRKWRPLQGVENMATWPVIDVLEYLPGIHLMIYRR